MAWLRSAFVVASGSQDVPRLPGVKRLSNHPHSYRLRVGNHRVLFEFDGAVKIITIEEVKKRDERTY